MGGQINCKCGHIFPDAAGKYGCPNCEGQAMTQQNHRANVWITPETREQLKAIGKAHGAVKGREVSPGIRVAAGYHTRLVEALEKMMRQAYTANGHYPSDDNETFAANEIEINQARALLAELQAGKGGE